MLKRFSESILFKEPEPEVDESEVQVESEVIDADAEQTESVKEISGVTDAKTE